MAAPKEQDAGGKLTRAQTDAGHARRGYEERQEASRLARNRLARHARTPLPPCTA